jgi:hypothetical protein
MMVKKRILITGSHRSGTTWLAKVISASRDVYYITEPFNISFNHPNNPIKKWFHYIPAERRDPGVYNYVKDHFDFGVRGLITDLKKVDSPSWARGIALRQVYKLSRPYKVMKDPIAIMSADWLYKNFDLKVVVSIRHPAAFVSSLKIKEWKFDFGQFLTQNELIDRHFADFRPELERMSIKEYPIVEQGALLWNIIYTRVLQYMDVYKDWYYLRHEDISSQPETHYEKLLNYLGIPFCEDIRNMIHETTSSKKNRNTIEVSLRDSLYRDSKENISSWKGRLSASESDFVHGYTQPVWKNFYGENDW